MKVLLVQHPKLDQGGYVVAPTGLLYLHAGLRQDGHDVHLVDGNLVGWEGVESAIDEFCPDLLGVTAMTPGRHNALRVAAYAAQRGIRVVVGGVHATLMSDQMMGYDDVWGVCVGEGENMIRSLANGDDLASIPNLTWRVKGKEYRSNPCVVNTDLDSYPFPSWDICDWPAYHARGSGPRVIFSRGCPWGHCVFCSVGTQWHDLYRTRSPENVVEELRWLCGTLGERQITFADDTISGDLNKTKELMRQIIAANLDIHFYATTRVNCVDQELLGLMSRAGCYEISYGIEGAADANHVYAKGASLEQAERAMAWTKAAGIEPCALMIYNGIQAERVDRATRQWVDGKVRHIGSVDQLWILPGTPLYAAMKAHNLMDDSFWLGPEPYRIYRGELDHLTRQEWTKYHVQH